MQATTTVANSSQRTKPPKANTATHTSRRCVVSQAVDYSYTIPLENIY